MLEMQQSKRCFAQHSTRQQKACGNGYYTICIMQIVWHEQVRRTKCASDSVSFRMQNVTVTCQVSKQAFVHTFVCNQDVERHKQKRSCVSNLQIDWSKRVRLLLLLLHHLVRRSVSTNWHNTTASWGVNFQKVCFPISVLLLFNDFSRHPRYSEIMNLFFNLNEFRVHCDCRQFLSVPLNNCLLFLETSN